MGKTSNDPTLTPTELTGLRDQAASATAGCCTCVFRKDGDHGPSRKLRQMKADGTTFNGQNDSAWKGEIIIDQGGSPKTVYVVTRIKMVNSTSNTSDYPGTVAMTDDDLRTRIAPIPAAIRAAWNAKPYKLKITDSKCGENTFNVKFDAALATSSEHFSVDFINAPMSAVTPDTYGVESYRSFVLPPNFGKFNVQDSRSATLSGAKTLEPHEYGHMIGLKDEYSDAARDRGGVEYEFVDGTKELAAANTNLMSGMSVKTAQPERYCLTVAYAVIAVFARNGITVTALDIE